MQLKTIVHSLMIPHPWNENEEHYLRLQQMDMTGFGKSDIVPPPAADLMIPFLAHDRNVSETDDAPCSSSIQCSYSNCSPLTRIDKSMRWAPFGECFN